MNKYWSKNGWPAAAITSLQDWVKLGEVLTKVITSDPVLWFKIFYYLKA
jgi:hypothetical protein